MDMNNKVALVTGGGAGIGYATAIHLRQRGARVVIADRREDTADIADALDVDYVKFDVADSNAWDHAISTLEQRHGGLDALILNAGTMVLPPAQRVVKRLDIQRLLDTDYQQVMRVNCDGVVFGTRAALPLMLQRDSAHIVMVSSVSGIQPAAYDPIYGGSKHFVIGFMRSMAAQLQSTSIYVNAVCPGVTKTDIVDPETYALMDQSGAQYLPADHVAETILRAVASDQTGKAYICQAGQEDQTYQFNAV